ncbi:MAG: cupin domain-containing protein [Bacillota bacterium]
MTEYLDVETGQQYTFRQGDFYVTPPGIKYAQRSQPGTDILFIKTPPEVMIKRLLRQQMKSKNG